MERLHFETIDSTNSYLKKNYFNLNHLSWVTTSYQTEGRGRLNKIWYGDENSLLASILIKEELPLHLIQMIPLLAAKSLHQVLSKYHQSIHIKWPNDLLIDDQKIAGILVESITIGNKFEAFIIGFGVNLNDTFFPSEIKDYSTSLSKKTNRYYDINQMLIELNQQFLIDYELYKKNHIKVIHYVNNHLAYQGKVITYKEKNKTFHGVIEYINNDGNLVINRNNQFHIVSTGEIALLK
jgi:BirA family transcriptional regulator, biotin operon repressor / biotin---[acetyl-CoA-carboxylase] ligase